MGPLLVSSGDHGRHGRLLVVVHASMGPLLVSSGDERARSIVAHVSRVASMGPLLVSSGDKLAEHPEKMRVILLQWGRCW